MSATALQQELMGLVSQLAKLLKVMRHSDPTASTKKKELYRKYQKSLDKLYLDVKNRFDFDEISRQIGTLMLLDEFEPEGEEAQAVIKKLNKDLQEKFYIKPMITEFEKPSATPKRKKKTSPPKPEPYDPNASLRDAEFMEMIAGQDERQKQATRSLQRLIQAINKVGPDALESHINKAAKKSGS